MAIDEDDAPVVVDDILVGVALLDIPLLAVAADVKRIAADAVSRRHEDKIPLDDRSGDHRRAARPVGFP